MHDVIEFIEKQSGIEKSDTIVLGISGGPDSMVLLQIFNKLKDRLKIKLVCAHVNHNLRKESAEEKLFIENYCDENDIYFEFMKIEEYGEDNFHNEARTIRYNYFEKVVKDYHAKFLVTAHHGDDLIETILMRIVRGSSLKGYSGFSKIIKKDNYKILRPLISVTKDEILEYAKENQIEYRIDKTNFKDVYTRNRYRKYVLPFLKNEDKNVHKKFLKFSETLNLYNDYIDKITSNICKNIIKNNKIDIKEYKQLDYVLQIKIIYNELEHIYGDDLMFLTDSHIKIIFDLINSKKANAFIHLPNNIIAKKSYNNLVFEINPIDLKPYEIEIIDIVNLPNGKNIDYVKNCEWTNNFCTRLSTDEVKLPLYVRTRKNGDIMEVKGLKGRKKINEIFINEKIKTNDRDMWPIVCDSCDNIVWLPGLKKSKFDKENKEEYDIVLRYY